MSRQTEKTMKELNAFLEAQRPDGSGEEIVYIMDVKCGPLLGGSYLGKPGVVPAYHMNKTHWLGGGAELPGRVFASAPRVPLYRRGF